MRSLIESDSIPCLVLCCYQVEFKCILFVPGEATGLYEDYNNRKAGMKLYVRKVLIQEDFEDLLPRYPTALRVNQTDRYTDRLTVLIQ